MAERRGKMNKEQIVKQKIINEIEKTTGKLFTIDRVSIRDLSILYTAIMSNSLSVFFDHDK